MDTNPVIDFLVEHGIKAAVFWTIGAITAFLLFGVLNLNLLGNFPGVEKDAWQAVFLENGQVYFGKLTEHDQNFVSLSSVYYLRETKDVEEESANLDLIKLGGEVHGPEDEMIISKSAILYFENMKETSRVVQSIQKTRQ